MRGSSPDPVSECPSWCRANHAAGLALHLWCAGEIRWQAASVVVTLARQRGTDVVELAYHAADGSPAIVNLNDADARQLRDALNRVIAAGTARPGAPRCETARRRPDS